MYGRSPPSRCYEQGPPPYARHAGHEPAPSRWQPRGPPPAREHAPSSTLMLRGLAPVVRDEMIFSALQAYRPVSARIMHDKATGESRGFAFVDFESVEDSTAAMNAFASEPLVLENRVVNIIYADSFRRRPPHTEEGRSRGESWGSNRNIDPHHDQQHGDRWALRKDWICDACNVTNFARRTSCFQCTAPKTPHSKEVTAFRPRHQDDFHQRYQNVVGSFPPPPVQGTQASDDERGSQGREGSEMRSRVTPSRVLMVRMLPPDIEEGELHVAFAEFDGVQDIRLIRDRATNLSRGFGFIEFHDVEAATQALTSCERLLVHNSRVEVSYAREALAPKAHNPAESSQGGPRPGSSLMVTAMEQAQWSLAHGRASDAMKTTQQVTVADDVSALLNNVAAEVVPQFEEPKKSWPPPFETAGGSYVYASEYGLYWDPDSLFYYDAQSKLYYNSFTGAYYQCVDPSASGTDAFKTFVPALPADDSAFKETVPIAEIPTETKPGLSLSLKKDKKKTPAISFGIKTTAFAPASSVFESNSKTKAVGPSGATAPTASVGVTTVGMKRKSAVDIAKWSQRQREAKMEGNEGAANQQQHVHAAGAAQSTGAGAAQQSDSSAKTANANAADVGSVMDSLTNVPQEVPICLLCRRKFGSLEQLRKHEKLSKLHLANLSKAKENKQLIAAQYREHEQEMERDAKKQRKEDDVATSRNTQSTTAASKPPEPAVSSLESGIGGKMLKMMGWKSGQGLGKHGTGITAPIQAAGTGGRSETAGLGLKVPATASVDLSEATSDKERRRILARARYDADKS